MLSEYIGDSNNRQASLLDERCAAVRVLHGVYLQLLGFISLDHRCIVARSNIVRWLVRVSILPPLLWHFCSCDNLVRRQRAP